MREKLLPVTSAAKVINCFKETFDKNLDIYLSKYVLVLDRQPFLFHLKYNFRFLID